MAFYKALENFNLVKSAEADLKNFSILFFNKSTLKGFEAFDKELKQKVSNFFSNEKKSELFLSRELTGFEGDFLVVRDFDNKKQDYKKYNWVAGLFSSLDRYGVESANIYVDTSKLAADKDFVFNLAKIAEKATYRYTDTNPNSKKEAILKELFLCVDKLNNSLSKSFDLGMNVGRGANTARNLGNRPANHATPTYIADQVKELANEIGGFSVEVLEEKDMEKLGMGSLLSVSRGSVEPAKLVTMEYKGGKKGAKPIVLVGKGVTFDTGGISLKPSPKMDEMKWDMSGAGSVIGLSLIHI